MKNVPAESHGVPSHSLLYISRLKGKNLMLKLLIEQDVARLSRVRPC